MTKSQEKIPEINERYEKWIYVSHGLANIEIYAVISAQEMGRLDCICIAEDARICSSLGSDADQTNNLVRDNDHLLFSRLWVLGAYELIRVISEHYRKKPRIIDKTRIMDKNLYHEIESLEKRFLRLRVPLAKLKPANHYENTDFHFAHPVSSPKYGCAWIISKDDVIHRRELSDELLILLEKIRHATEKN